MKVSQILHMCHNIAPRSIGGEVQSFTLVFMARREIGLGVPRLLATQVFRAHFGLEDLLL